MHGPDGRPARELTLGHDIQALVTDRDGRIWMAFGDEGVYGDHPASQAGLLGTDAAGRTVWSPRRGELPGYPLEGLAGATEGRAVWLAWYPDSRGSHLTRIDPSTGTSSSLRLPVRLPVGFAIDGRRAVFLLGSGELVWCELTGKEWRERRRERLRVPGELDRGGRSAGTACSGSGRGTAGTGWWRSGRRGQLPLSAARLARAARARRWACSSGGSCTSNSQPSMSSRIDSHSRESAREWRRQVSASIGSTEESVAPCSRRRTSAAGACRVASTVYTGAGRRSLLATYAAASSAGSRRG